MCDVKLKTCVQRSLSLILVMGTIENLSEGSTLFDIGVYGSGYDDMVSFAPASAAGSTDDLCHRAYRNSSMTGDYMGPRVSKNTRLYINKPEVQCMRSVVTDGNNRNEGDWRRGMSLAAYNGDMVRRRSEVYTDKQPVGCNGPVMCKLGLKMKGVIVAHNPDLPVLAAESEAFSQGGVFVNKARDVVSMVGAGGDMPTNQNEGGSRLNNAVGLNFVVTIGPGSAVTAMQQKNFVGGVSNGTGGVG